jgi:pimeloyl-ACP methyl ester carboxylesterase
MGHSFGSTVGQAVAQKRPDLLHAYIGVGQAIDWRENERVGLAWTLDRARREGNAPAIGEPEALRPYPDSSPFTIDKADAWRKWAIGWGALAATERPGAMAAHFRWPRCGRSWRIEHVRPLAE